MPQLEEVFQKIQLIKKEQKEIKQAYKDALLTTPNYEKVVEELKVLKAKKQEIEIDVRGQFREEFTKLDDLKIDLESEQELMNDMAINQLMKGETVKIVTEDQVEYDPVFSVKFKKAN